MKRLITIVISILFVTCLSTVKAATVYKGAIGPYKVHVVLYDSRQGGFDGYYYYDNNPKSRFNLKVVEGDECTSRQYKATGTNPEGCVQVVMYEYTPSGKNSGKFVGTMSSSQNASCWVDLIMGTFTNISNGKQYSFRVTSYDCSGY